MKKIHDEHILESDEMVTVLYDDNYEFTIVGTDDDDLGTQIIKPFDNDLHVKDIPEKVKEVLRQRNYRLKTNNEKNEKVSQNETTDENVSQNETTTDEKDTFQVKETIEQDDQNLLNNISFQDLDRKSAQVANKVHIGNIDFTKIAQEGFREKLSETLDEEEKIEIRQQYKRGEISEPVANILIDEDLSDVKQDK